MINNNILIKKVQKIESTYASTLIFNTLNIQCIRFFCTFLIEMLVLNLHISTDHEVVNSSQAKRNYIEIICLTFIGVLYKNSVLRKQISL